MSETPLYSEWIENDPQVRGLIANCVKQRQRLSTSCSNTARSRQPEDESQPFRIASQSTSKESNRGRRIVHTNERRMS